jgi:SulP family sulfate permease
MSSQRRGEPERPLRELPAFALRESLREGYARADLRADLMAGAVVALVAVPLSMALAINSGVPPQHGLYTGIVAGIVIALLGGSRWQVSGPTAAFIVLLAPVAAKYGLAGLATASLVAGAVLIVMGLARLGKAIEFIPYPVTTGFTSGIAVVIATTQVKDFLGLTVADWPETYAGKIVALAESLPTFRVHEVAVGLATLLLLTYWPKVTSKVPPALVALPLAGVAGVALARWAPQWAPQTIADRFSYVADGVVHRGIPSLPPMPVLPWDEPGPAGHAPEWTLAMVEEVFLKGLGIALLGAIESLLSAVVADGIRGTRHDPDAELIAQGTGNLVAPFFGGFAATGALARTATNIRSGARSPFAGVFHALFVLVAVVAFAPALSYLPMAALAALLLRVAWQMSEVRHFVHTMRIAPRTDVLLLLACFGLTVVFDMTIAVGTGVMLAALVFMKRMADVGEARTVRPGERHRQLDVPKGVVVYEITGPLFFGSAGKATRALRQFGEDARVVILDLENVPVIDGTGLANLEVCIERMKARRTRVILAGVQAGPLRAMVRAGWRGSHGVHSHLTVRRSLEHAIDDARRMLAEDEAAGAR